MMSGNVLKQRVEQSHFERSVIRNGDMVFSIAQGSKSNLRTDLPAYFISQSPERPCLVRTIAVAGHFHAMSTSSRT